MRPEPLIERRGRSLAAKFRAETILAEPPKLIEPTDEAFDQVFAHLILPLERFREFYPEVRRQLKDWDANHN